MFFTHKAPNTTIAEFANTVDPDETAQNEPSHQHNTVYSENFSKILQM